MEQQKTTTQEDRKKKMLMVLPLLFLPFTILLFYSLGGGKTKTKETVEQKGINTNLPSAQIDNTKPSDKLSLYKAADRDAERLTLGPALDPFARNLFGPAAADSSSSPAAAAGYGYHPGPPATPHPQASLADNEARVQEKLARLQQVLKAAEDTSTRLRTPPVQPMPSLGTYPGLSSLPPASLANDTPVQDPQLGQLNDMLEKVLDVQHPERVKERMKEASAKEPTRIFQVTAAANDSPEGWEQHLPKDSAARPAAIKRILNASRRFFELGDETGEDGQPNTIQAVVQETQQLVSGSTIKLRLTRGILVQGRQVPAGTDIHGTCELTGDRLQVHIQHITYGASIFPVSLSVYGLDGVEGIAVPGAISRDASKDGAAQAVQAMQLATMSQSLGAQAAASGVETVKTLLQKKLKKIQVTVKAGLPVLLYSDRQ